jgi:hypothetical protein
LQLGFELGQLLSGRQERDALVLDLLLEPDDSLLAILFFLGCFLGGVFGVLGCFLFGLGGVLFLLFRGGIVVRVGATVRRTRPRAAVSLRSFILSASSCSS